VKKGNSTKPATNQASQKKSVRQPRKPGVGRAAVSRITLNLITAIVLIVFTVSVVLIWMAESQNTQAAEATSTMVQGGIAATSERIKSTTNDYAWWDDHYNAYEEEDIDWLEENVGASVYDTGSADFIALISPKGELKYAWISEEDHSVTEGILTQEEIDSILSLAKNAPLENSAAVGAYLVSNGQVYSVGIAHLAPILHLEGVDVSTLPIIVMGVALSEEYLRDLGESFLISDLQLSSASIHDPKYASYPEVVDLTETSAGRMIWTPPTPGYVVLQSIILPISIVLGIFCIVALATVFRARRLAVVLAKTNEELEKSEGELAEQLITVAGEKEKIESIVSSIGEGLIAIDPQGIVFLCNSIGALLLGKKRADVIGASFENVFAVGEKSAGKNVSPELQSVFGILNTRKTVEVPEVLFTRADGNVVTLSLTATPIEADGSFIGGIIVFNDVTEQKMVENAKRQFITTAAHQLRTPLSGVKWAISSLVENKSKSTASEKKSLLLKSYESINRVISLVNDLLNVDKIESGQVKLSLAPTDVTVSLHDALTDLMSQMEQKKLKIEYKPLADAPSIDADAVNMRVVFQNLLENSLHYTPEKGSVTISAEIVGKEMRFNVADTGIGIPRGEQKSIFLRFFRASNAVAVQPNGSGLGLYICKQIVEQHNGKIWFESEEGKGATFHVVLPMKTSAKKGK